MLTPKQKTAAKNVISFLQAKADAEKLNGESTAITPNQLEALPQLERNIIIHSAQQEDRDRAITQKAIAALLGAMAAASGGKVSEFADTAEAHRLIFDLLNSPNFLRHNIACFDWFAGLGFYHAAALVQGIAEKREFCIANKQDRETPGVFLRMIKAAAAHWLQGIITRLCLVFEQDNKRK